MLRDPAELQPFSHHIKLPTGQISFSNRAEPRESVKAFHSNANLYRQNASSWLFYPFSSHLLPSHCSAVSHRITVLSTQLHSAHFYHTYRVLLVSSLELFFISMGFLLNWFLPALWSGCFLAYVVLASLIMGFTEFLHHQPIPLFLSMYSLVRLTSIHKDEQGKVVH